MQKRNALGRGLDSLISMGSIPADTGSAINEIELSRIDANPEQPRSTFDEETLAELADSIRELGIIQPLSLRLKDDGRYQIIAGERRWRAAGMAGLTSVPAYVRTVSDSEMTEMALIENIQREDLNAIEVALTFRKLIDTYNLTQERL
ncbi:MAG: ParB/RepB/Spo0J family partition protein, partial [Muribaculaceae bacterium]|nr:ParB/RepB/Spo0J family partition protein [Muribaculaceae bacterium]